MPTFAILSANGLYLKVKPNFTLDWVQCGPNTYTSRYQAKRHLKELDNVPDNVKVVPLVIEEGNVNG